MFSKRLTINKGVDNILQFQFLNQEQKPVDISLFNFNFKIISNDSQSLLLGKQMVKVNARLGTAQAIITQADTNNLQAQPASWSIERTSLGVLSNITVTNGGSGYITAPNVVINGTGTGAQATAFITGSVSNVILLSGGSGYRSAPNVAFAGGSGSGAIAQAELTYSVDSVTLINPGLGYDSNANIVFSAPADGNTANTATANLVITAGSVTDIIITNPGSGYISPPGIRITGANTVVATANCTIAGSVERITVYQGGRNYTAPPAVTITGGFGSGAQAVAAITNKVDSVLITNRGQNFYNAPIIEFQGGNPQANATAVATVSGDPYFTAGYVDDQASARGAVDIVDSVYPAFTASRLLTLPPTANMTVAPSPTANIYFQPTAYTSFIPGTGNPMITFQIDMANYSGTIQPQGSPDPDNDLIWYDIGNLYQYNQQNGTVYFNVVGYHPWMRLVFNLANTGNANANVLLIDTHIPKILYR